MTQEETLAIGDEVMDYLGCNEIDIDEIEGIYHQIIYEFYMCF